jgi:hypothetical protein
MYIVFIQKGKVPQWTFILNSALPAAGTWDLKGHKLKIKYEDYEQ